MIIFKDTRSGEGEKTTWILGTRSALKLQSEGDGVSRRGSSFSPSPEGRRRLGFRAGAPGGLAQPSPLGLPQGARLLPQGSDKMHVCWPLPALRARRAGRRVSVCLSFSRSESPRPLRGCSVSQRGGEFQKVGLISRILPQIAAIALTC